MPISNLLACYVGSSSSPLEEQHDSLQKVQQHAQKIESLTFELQEAQNVHDKGKEKMLIQKIKLENQELQKSTLLLKEALKVPQESLQTSSPHHAESENP